MRAWSQEARVAALVIALLVLAPLAAAPRVAFAGVGKIEAVIRQMFGAGVAVSGTLADGQSLAYDSSSGTWGKATYINIGTTTDAEEIGDFSAGIAGDDRIFFDQSTGRFLVGETGIREYGESLEVVNSSGQLRNLSSRQLSITESVGGNVCQTGFSMVAPGALSLTTLDAANGVGVVLRSRAHYTPTGSGRIAFYAANDSGTTKFYATDSSGNTADLTSHEGEDLSLGTLDLSGPIVVAEQASVATPAANELAVYAADDGGTTRLYAKDSAGTVTDLTAAGGGLIDFAHYYHSGSQEFQSGSGAYEVIDFDTSVTASANVTTGASWAYTVPADGILTLTVRVQLANTADMDTNENVSMVVFADGTAAYHVHRREFVTSPTGTGPPYWDLHGTVTFAVTAGQDIDVRFFMALNAAVTANLYDGDGPHNYVMIKLEPAP